MWGVLCFGDESRLLWYYLWWRCECVCSPVVSDEVKDHQAASWELVSDEIWHAFRSHTPSLCRMSHEFEHSGKEICTNAKKRKLQSVSYRPMARGQQRGNGMLPTRSTLRIGPSATYKADAIRHGTVFRDVDSLMFSCSFPDFGA